MSKMIDRAFAALRKNPDKFWEPEELRREVAVSIKTRNRLFKMMMDHPEVEYVKGSGIRIWKEDRSA